MNETVQTFNLPIEVEKRKRIETIVKFSLLILLSNFFTYLLFSPSLPAKLEKKIIQRPGYVKLFLPLKTMFLIPEQSEVSATIMDINNNIIFKKVYIRSVKEIDLKGDLNYNSDVDSKESVKYEVDISQNDFKKINTISKKELLALPYQTSFSETNSSKHSSMEFNF